VQNGSVGVICPQANPAWTFIARQFLTELVAGNASQFNYTESSLELQAYLQSPAVQNATPDPRTSEDCLFLDVIVPKAVFDNANNKHRKRAGAGAPVLVW